MALDQIRVAMVGRYPRTPGKPGGGPEAVAEVLADGLAASGRAQMHFITSVRGSTHRECLDTRSGVTVHHLPLFETLGNFTGFLVDVRRIRRELQSISPDLVHVHTTTMYAWAALERGYPSILAVRGIHARETPFQRGWSRYQYLLGDAYERDSLRRARHAVFLNRYTFNTVKHLLRGAEVRYIDNPADDSFFDVPNREEEGRLLVLGMIRRLKGQEHAIRAVSILKKHGRKVNLYCVGPVLDADYDSEIRRLIREENVEDCVHLVGQASRKDAQDHISKASVLIVPSLVENAPLVISESMAVGKPIVASPAGGIPEMIDNGVNGIIVPFADSAAIAGAVETLLDDPARRVSLATAARETAEKRFRLSVSVEKTLDYYESVLGGSHA